MSVSGQTVINAALQWLNELEDGESANASESANALLFLNRIVDSWNIREDMATSSVDDTVSLTNGQNFATLVTRYVKVVGVTVLNTQGPAWACKMLTAKEWQEFDDKAASSAKTVAAFYDRGFPTGKLHFVPTPLVNMSAVFTAWAPQASFPDLTTPVTLNPGYELALVTELAIELSPNYEVDPSSALLKTNVTALGKINELNASLWGAIPNSTPVTPIPAQEAALADG